MSEADVPAVDPLPTHSHVMHSLYELGDADTKFGISAEDVVEHVAERTDLERADIWDSIEYLNRTGEIYAPKPARLRRTEQHDERWERFGVACHWQEALVEVTMGVGRGLKPHELVTRYDVEDGDRIEELVTRGMVEVKLHDENEKLTLEDIDKAADRIGVSRIVTDGGVECDTGQNDFAFKVPAHPNAEEDHFIRNGDGSYSFWNDSDRAAETTIITWDESETPFGQPQESDTDRDHIYVGRIPGAWKWSTDYDVIAEWAGGEENVSIMHTRAHEYVLDLSGKYPFECSMNQRYDCGHGAYGPPRRLPRECPECKPVATDGGVSSSDAERATTDVDPAEMDDADIHDEWDRVAGLLDYGGVATVEESDDELWDRRVSLWNEMKSRADAEAPECPKCANQSWSQSVGGPKYCDQCDLHLGFSHQDLIDRIDDYWNTVRSVGAESDRNV